MRLTVILLFALIVHVELRYQNVSDDHDEQRSASFNRQKKYSSRKKVLDEDVETDDEQFVDKPQRPIYSAKNKSRSGESETNRRVPLTTTPATNYADEASLCINEFDVKSEQLVKVKEFKNGAHMIRIVRIEEPSSSHGLDIKDICMLNCCVEKSCDLAMLSEQATNDGYKCYLFACNGSCTFAPHRDYTSMILKKDLGIESDTPATPPSNSKVADKHSDASSSTLSNTCRSTEFSCRDGTCIPYYDVCNTYEDCPSGIDEAMCSPEFILHQQTQKENRKKPSATAPETDNDPNSDLEEVIDEILDDDATSTTTMKTWTKSSTPSKTSTSKGKAKGTKAPKNNGSTYFYNIDLETQDRVAKLQKLKEHLEETKGPEAWYHLFQTLIQHQQQDHTTFDIESNGVAASSSSNDDDNFKDHLLALEQQWIADRQKTTTSSTTTSSTTRRVKPNSRKTTSTTPPATTRRTKINPVDNARLPQRPSIVPDEEIIDDEEEEDGGENGDRYYWQSAYDDSRNDRYSYPRKNKLASSTSSTTTRRSRTRYPANNRESPAPTILRANVVETEDNPHTRSFLRESSLILLSLMGLVFTIILLVLVGFYCRDSWKRGRIFKNRSTDADYLINGLYL